MRSCSFIAQSAGATKYIDCISAEGTSPAHTHTSKCSGYDTKQSDGEAPGMELCGMWSTPLLPLLPGSL